MLFCPFANAEALAEAILLLKKDSGLKEKISENAYRLFKERFSLEKTGARLYTILEEAISLK